MIDRHYSNPCPIGLFDSGVGGISVANQVKRALPAENLIYVADSAHAPYGNKSSAYILSRARRIVEFLIAEQAKLIVVACNTATLSCIEALRKDYPIPFVGVEPGVKPAVQASFSGKVAVLATPLTINSARYHRLIENVANGKQVISQPCDGLADQIELGDFESPQTMALLKRFVQPLLDKGVDQIALGCTHYGFVVEQLETLIAGQAQLVDTGAAIARQTKAVLANLQGLNVNSTPGWIKTYTSDVSRKCEKTMLTLWEHEVEPCQLLPQ